VPGNDLEITMAASDDEISRRCFLNKTGLMMVSAWPLSIPVSAIYRAQAQKAPGPLPHRSIDPSLCIGCGSCVPLCPVGAISLGDEVSSIDPHECTECGTCTRAEICPVDAIKPVKLGWPRVLRETFSNPLAEHETTGIAGRGTEGIKTNDAQNRFKKGDLGVFIEVGRPVFGGRFSDVERVVKKFKAHGYEVIPQNPISALINDPETGALKPEILDEKIISCVIELVLPDTAAGELLEMVRELSEEVDSVFSLSVALRADEEGRSPFEDLFGPDVYCLPNAKANIGMAVGIAGEEA
jgi:ferredoxin